MAEQHRGRKTSICTCNRHTCPVRLLRRTTGGRKDSAPPLNRQTQNSVPNHAGRAEASAAGRRRVSDRPRDLHAGRAPAALLRILFSSRARQCPRVSEYLCCAQRFAPIAGASGPARQGLVCAERSTVRRCRRSRADFQLALLAQSANDSVLPALGCPAPAAPAERNPTQSSSPAARVRCCWPAEL